MLFPYGASNNLNHPVDRKRYKCECVVISIANVLYIVNEVGTCFRYKLFRKLQLDTIHSLDELEFAMNRGNVSSKLPHYK